MLINMDANFKCESQYIENVKQFRYLGLIIDSNGNHTSAILENRLLKAKAAFNAIKCHSHLLCLNNRRVRS